jgi:hypothetical protein
MQEVAATLADAKHTPNAEVPERVMRGVDRWEMAMEMRWPCKVGAQTSRAGQRGKALSGESESQTKRSERPSDEHPAFYWPLHHACQGSLSITTGWSFDVLSLQTELKDAWKWKPPGLLILLL